MEFPKKVKMLQNDLKKRLLEAVFVDIERNPEKALYWADKWGNKLLPNETTIAGNQDGDPIKISLYDPEQIKAIARRTVRDGEIPLKT